MTVETMSISIYISTKPCVSKGGNHDQEKVAVD